MCISFFRYLSDQEIRSSYIFHYAFLRKFCVGNFSQRSSLLAFVMVDMAFDVVDLGHFGHYGIFAVVSMFKTSTFFDFNIKNGLGGVGWGGSEQTAFSSINIKINLSQFISVSNPSQLTYLWLFCFPLLFF